VTHQTLLGERVRAVNDTNPGSADVSDPGLVPKTELESRGIPAIHVGLTQDTMAISPATTRHGRVGVKEELLRRRAELQCLPGAGVDGERTATGFGT
jgi:hypothetical protein